MAEQPSARFWSIQRLGLAALVCLNFFPLLHVPTRYLFFGLVISSLVALWREGAPWWVSTPIDLQLLCFLAWVLVTIPFSIDPDYSFKEWRKLGAQILLFYWAIRVTHRVGAARATRSVLLATVLAAGACGGYAIVEFVWHGGTWRGRDVRAGAMGSDYNWLSTYMVMALPMVLAATMIWRDWWMKLLGHATTLVCFVAELLAFTRAGWLGLVAEALVGLWYVGYRRVVAGLVIVALGAGLGVVSVLNVRDARETTDVTDPWTLRARVDVWKLAALDVLEHPIVGVGYGNYNFVKRYAGRPELEKAYGPHSTFVVVGLGSGLPALGLFIWILIALFRAFARQLRDAVAEEARAQQLVALGAALLLVGFAVRNLFDYMLIGGLANVFWLVMAVSLVATRAGDPAPAPLRSVGGSDGSFPRSSCRLPGQSTRS